MKRVLSVLLIMGLLFTGVAFAADPPGETKTLDFTWEYPVDIAYIDGWALYWSPASGKDYVKVADIVYSGNPLTTYTAAETLSVPGTPDTYGKTVKRYFVLTARGKGSRESLYSNEVSADFKIGWPDPSAPVVFRVNVRVGP